MAIRKEMVMILGDGGIMLRALQHTVARTMASRDHVMPTVERPPLMTRRGGDISALA
jgi:hypothetical protein